MTLDFELSNDALIIGTSNRLVLTMINRSDAIQLKGGPPISQQDREEASPSALYLSFTTLAGGIKIVADGWTAAAFGGPLPTIGLFPDKNLAFAEGARVEFTIDVVEVSGEPRHADLGIDYHLPAETGASQRGLSVRSPAPVGGENRPLHVHQKLDGDGVVYTSVDRRSPALKNELTLFMSNPSPTNPLVPRHVRWRSDPPTFTISFVLAQPPGYGALTTPELGEQISVHVVERTSARWTVDKQPGPYWVLTPIEETNHEVLGTDADASVTVDVTDVVSQLPLGDDVDPTLMYVNFAHIPGYADGCVTLQVTKAPGPSVTHFYTDPGSVPFGHGSVTTTPHWETQNTDAVFLDPVGAVPGSGALARPIPVNARDCLTLTAKRGNLHVDRVVKIASAARTSVTLPLRDVAIVVPTEAGASYVLDRVVNSQCLAVSASGVVTPVELIHYAGGPRTPDSVASACSDGSTIYVVMTGSGTPVELVTIDAARGVARSAIELMDSSPLFDPQVALSADSSLLCFGSQYSAQGDPWEVKVDVIDTATFSVVSSASLLNAMPQGLAQATSMSIVVGISNDGSEAYLVGPRGVSAFEARNGLPIGWIEIESALGGRYQIESWAVNAADRLAYVVARLDGGPTTWLLAIDLRPTGQALPIVAKRGLEGSGTFPLTLSADGSLLFVARPDELLAVDTGDFSPCSISCGAGDYDPAVIAVGAHRNVVHSTAGADLTTVTIDGL